MAEKKSKSSFRAFKIAAIYAVFGLLWILFSDQLLLLVTDDAEYLARLQTLKGWFFIILTASMLFVLVRRALNAQSRGDAFLRISEKRFRTLLNTLPDLIWLKDADGVYLTCNKTFERFFGAKEAEIIGKTDYDFVDPELAEFFRENDRRAMAAGRPTSNEEWITFADNGYRALLLTTKMPMYDEDGEIIGVLGIGRDITELRRAEKERLSLESQLHQMQKIESIGQLAGGVAHDFNNMLGVILGHAELALIKAGRAQSVVVDLEEIRKAAQHSADLTRQLLTFARKEMVEPKILDLNETIAGMLKMLQRLLDETIRLDWEPVEGLWAVKIDPSQVGQILANLCVNARDAIEAGGRVVIGTKNCRIGEGGRSLRPDLLPPGDYVQFSVRDNGRGMTAEVMEKIFEPFYTTKEIGAGTGMGLATVYGAVKQNNGFINVQSAPGSGSLFQVYLPRMLDEVAGEISSATAPPQGGSETILVVEDNAMLLQLIVAMLEEQGYRVKSFDAAEEALAFVREQNEPIQLLISDMVMPVMSGQQMAKQIKEQRPELKVLFMSGYSDAIAVGKGESEEEIHFLAKPVTMEVLAAKVRSLLDAD